MNNLDKRYYTGLSKSHRPDLQPNGKVVKCIEDKGNGYSIVTTDEQIEPNTWLINKKYLTEIQ